MKLSGRGGVDGTSTDGPLPADSGSRLRTRLRELAADGLGCLVTGHVSTERYREETRKLFGAAENHRLRTMVLTSAPDAPDEWFPGSLRAGDPTHELVALPNVARSARAAVDRGESLRWDGGAVGRDAAEAAMVGAVRAVEDRTPGPTGAMVHRFGLHRWDVFEHDVPDARAVLDTVLGAVHERGGLSHVHYPRHVDDGRDPLDDPVVRRLYRASDELDVVVELRVDGETGETQQRWRVPGCRLTGWSTL